jgi:hypothetical protein
MRTSEDTLLEAGASLETALQARPDREPQAWAARVDQALAAIQSAVAEHGTSLQAGADGVVEVSGGQALSPGTDRQVRHLRGELADLQREAEVLRGCLREVLNAGGEGGLTDRVRERAGHLLAAIDHYVRDEANLILANATTEVGAGD